MELQQLKGFLAVAKSGSFSKAAQKTFRTQPAVTLQVQALEKELGVRLFERLGHRKNRLTGEGRILLDLASPLLSDFDTLKARFSEICGEKIRGPVRIATHASVMVHLLPDVLKTFKKEFPECDLSVFSRSRQDIVAMVEEGEADMGITALQTVPRNLEYSVFARFGRILIAPKGHPLSKKKKITPKEIAPYPLIIPVEGTNTRKAIDRAMAGEGLEYRVAMELTGREAAMVYVAMGLGVSIINEYYLRSEDRKNLFVRDVSGDFGRAERGLITRKGGYLNRLNTEFIRILLAKFS